MVAFFVKVGLSQYSHKHKNREKTKHFRSQTFSVRNKYNRYFIAGLLDILYVPLNMEFVELCEVNCNCKTKRQLFSCCRFAISSSQPCLLSVEYNFPLPVVHLSWECSVNVFMNVNLFVKAFLCGCATLSERKTLDNTLSKVPSIMAYTTTIMLEKGQDMYVSCTPSLFFALHAFILVDSICGWVPTHIQMHCVCFSLTTAYMCLITVMDVCSFC